MNLPDLGYFHLDKVIQVIVQIDGTPQAYKPLVDSFYLGTYLSTDVNYLVVMTNYNVIMSLT